MRECFAKNAHDVCKKNGASDFSMCRQKKLHYNLQIPQILLLSFFVKFLERISATTQNESFYSLFCLHLQKMPAYTV